MAVIQRSEFALALNQISTERGVDVSIILESIKSAILAAYKKDHAAPQEEEEREEEKKEEDEDDRYEAVINEQNGETKIMKDGEDVTPPGFGRIATQTAKQVLLQKIRESEKSAIMEEYTKRIGTVVTANILRFIGPTIIVDIGKAEAVIPPPERIPNESYFLNKKMSVYIDEIRDDERKGKEIVVSRIHPGLIEGLLRREVPEVANGSVTIKGIVREPGNRAKIAVFSEASGIDPVGSCVGQKGVRIQAVIDALDGLEKIDVIQWNSDPLKFIANSLSPAKDLEVEVDEDKKQAIVKAPLEELPLVIGREGQNVRLAGKLTGYTIEVEGDGKPVEEKAEDKSSEDEKTSKPEDKSLKTKDEKVEKVEEDSNDKKEAQNKASDETKKTDEPEAKTEEAEDKSSDSEKEEPTEVPKND